MDPLPLNLNDPYVSPRASGAGCPPGSRWKDALVAALLAVLPCVVSWAYLEFGTGLIEEAKGSVKTPNPQKAPWYSHTQEIMLLTNPRLAIFSHRWTKVVYVSVVIWGMVAPAVFCSRGNRNEHRRCLSWIGLMPASLL